MEPESQISPARRGRSHHQTAVPTRLRAGVPLLPSGPERVLGHSRHAPSTPSNELPTTSAYPYPCRWSVKTWPTREIWEDNPSQNGCSDQLLRKGEARLVLGGPCPITSARWECDHHPGGFHSPNGHRPRSKGLLRRYAPQTVRRLPARSQVRLEHQLRHHHLPGFTAKAAPEFRLRALAVPVDDGQDRC